MTIYNQWSEIGLYDENMEKDKIPIGPRFCWTILVTSSEEKSV